MTIPVTDPAAVDRQADKVLREATAAYDVLLDQLAALEAEMRRYAETGVSTGWTGFIDQASFHWADRLAAIRQAHP